MTRELARLALAGDGATVTFAGETTAFDTYEAAKAALFAMTAPAFEAAKAAALARAAEFAVAA